MNAGQNRYHFHREHISYRSCLLEERRVRWEGKQISICLLNRATICLNDARMTRAICEGTSRARRKRASDVIATICLPSRLISWFEPRLPLPCMNRLCAGRLQAVLGQPGGEQPSKEAVFYGAKKRAATPCLDFACHPAFGSLRPPAFASSRHPASRLFAARLVPRRRQARRRSYP